MMIYLSHPIDKADSGVRSRVSQSAAAVEYEVTTRLSHLFKPGSAFAVGIGSKVDPTIESLNTIAQEKSHGVVVIWPVGSKSWGVPVEVERARQSGQPLAVLTDDEPTWSQPWGWKQQNIRKFAIGSEAEAVSWLYSRILVVGESNKRRPLPFQKLSVRAIQPTRAFDDDAGFDLYVSKRVKIKPGRFMDVPCAVAFELPSNSWAMLTGRSSTLRNKGLLVNQGIIDPGYRGELFAGVQNLSRRTVTVEAGERLAQLILMPNWTSEYDLIETNTLRPHPRGLQGFGSSGR
jgi:dUTP pyrophosphatase